MPRVNSPLFSSLDSSPRPSFLLPLSNIAAHLSFQLRGIVGRGGADIENSQRTDRYFGCAAPRIKGVGGRGTADQYKGGEKDENSDIINFAFWTHFSDFVARAASRGTKVGHNREIVI